MWMTTRIELLQSLTHQPTANKIYRIGCPDPNSKLGWLTEVHFWVTRLQIFEKYFLKEIKQIQINQLSQINFGSKSYFRKQCTYLVHEIMHPVRLLRELCNETLDVNQKNCELVDLERAAYKLKFVLFHLQNGILVSKKGHIFRTKNCRRCDMCCSASTRIPMIQEE